MTHFSFAQVIRGALLTGQKHWTAQWPDREPKAAYDVVIVGAGGHGLGAAYYLAKEHGITNVAVIDKGWLGGGNTGRNTTNRWPSLAFDMSAINDNLGSLFSAGFYYKTFMWPRAFWDRVYEPVIRNAAGLGVSPTEHDADSYASRFHHVDVLVVGAGPAGLAAALAAGRSDTAVAAAIGRELGRQQHQIELIASENIVSRDVLIAQGSVLTNKYAEGYPGKRYYGGCEFVDEVETIAIDRVKQLFGAGFANVQPHSGAQANQAVFLALLQPGDRIMGMSLAHGGHLTHGSPVTMSGKWFDVVDYQVRESDQLIDMDAVRARALETKPKLIIAGASAYPREIDFARFRAIADEVGAYLMVDMAHYAGLIAAGLYPNPVPHAHVVTSTTHKTLRGPRGGIILTNDEALAKKLNSAVFPGNQGGPLMHVIAAKAVAFGEALEPSFKTYAAQVIANARTLAATLRQGGLDIVSGGTDCHMVLVDLRPKGVKGRDAERALERAGLTCNKNAIPFDPEKPFVTSGVRLGTSAGTTRGFGEAEFAKVGELVLRVVDALAASGGEGDAAVEAEVLAEVRKLTDAHPIYAG